MNIFVLKYTGWKQRFPVRNDFRLRCADNVNQPRGQINQAGWLFRFPLALPQWRRAFRWVVRGNARRRLNLQADTPAAGIFGR
jgi:hypothetical protein